MPDDLGDITPWRTKLLETMARTIRMEHPNEYKEVVEKEPKDPWKHRSSGMRCKTCIWFVGKVVQDGETPVGRCRRHAPSMGGYPVVYTSDWCGDHRLDETKITE